MLNVGCDKMNSQWQIDLYDGLNNAVDIQDVIDVALKTVKPLGFDFCGFRAKSPLPLSQKNSITIHNTEDKVYQKENEGGYDEENAPILNMHNQLLSQKTYSMFWANSSNIFEPKDLLSIEFKMQWITTSVASTINKIKNNNDTILSSREKEILRWTGDGKTAEDIGKILHLSQSTINFHLRKVMFKLNAPNKTSAIIKAIHLNLLH